MDLMKLPRFPCAEGKRPLTTNGLYGARIDWPDDSSFPLIGVPTGSISGFDCLDVDVAGLGWLNTVELPLTRMHETRSGGRHLLFKHVDGARNSAGRIASGVDVRGDGGFIVWWPREGLRVWDGGIAEWPHWLLRLAIGQGAWGLPSAPCVGDVATINGHNSLISPQGSGHGAKGRPEATRHFQARSVAYQLAESQVSAVLRPEPSSAWPRCQQETLTYKTLPNRIFLFLLQHV